MGRMWIRLATVLGIVALSACRLGTDASSVTLRLSSEQHAVVQGGSSAMTVTVTNGSPRTVQVIFPDCPPYALKQENGTAGGPTGLICRAMQPAPVPLDPGQAASRDWRWSTNGPSEHGITASRPYLPAGRYVLSAAVIVDGRELRTARTVEILASNQ